METYQIGILTAVVSELLKFIPFLAKNDITKSLTVLVVAFAGTYFTVGFSPTNFSQVILTSFATYKLLVQPAATAVSLRTQG